jgi:hypothetical protein
MAKVVPTCFDDFDRSPVASARMKLPALLSTELFKQLGGGSISGGSELLAFTSLADGGEDWEMKAPDPKQALVTKLSGKYSADSSGDEVTASKTPVGESKGLNDEDSLVTKTHRKSGKLSPLNGRLQSETATPREESSLTSLFSYLSSHIDELTAGNDNTWTEFSAMTNSVYSKAGSDSIGGNVRKVLTELGYSPLHGWRRNTAQHVSLIFQKFSNLYLSTSTSQAPSHNRKDVGNLDSLTFCPDTLFLSFLDSHAPQLSCELVQTAVLLADISGFSKYAGKMCLQGSKGLDTLHKVTNEYLGRFVQTVYRYQGDGKLDAKQF